MQQARHTVTQDKDCHGYVTACAWPPLWMAHGPHLCSGLTYRDRSSLLLAPCGTSCPNPTTGSSGLLATMNLSGFRPRGFMLDAGAHVRFLGVWPTVVSNMSWLCTCFWQAEGDALLRQDYPLYFRAILCRPLTERESGSIARRSALDTTTRDKSPQTRASSGRDRLHGQSCMHETEGNPNMYN